MMILLIFICLLPTLCDAMGNIVDSKLSNSFGTHSMVFFSILFNIFFFPFIFLFGTPQILPIEAIPFAIFFAFVGVFYLYPYTLSLKNIDTSIVTALFNLGKIIVPILAFFIVGEKLNPNFYVGFLIIIFSVIFLSLQESAGKIRLNKAFFYMLGCSLLISFSSVIEKYTLNNIDFITLFFRIDLFSLILIIPLLFFPKSKNEIKRDFPILKKELKTFSLQAIFGFGGELLGIYALSVAPVSLTKSPEVCTRGFAL